MKAQNIQHLFWRAGFGLSPKVWKERQHWSIPQAVDFLFDKAKQQLQILHKASYDFSEQTPDKTRSKEELAKLRQVERKKVQSQNIEWLLQMGRGEESDLLQKMTLFWHGHFACTSKVSILAKNQLLTLKKHALGNFRALVIAIAKDPSMIRFLNNQQNRKNSPNENFARELMELFTIGRGNYTEQDIKAAARAFTGWSSNLKGEFVFKKRQHDFGSKTFMGQTGNFDGTDIIDIILQQKATAVFICKKIYRYFVNTNIDKSRIQQLADVFYQSDYDIALLMRTIFLSEWFYDTRNQRVKIKSPTEFLAGMIRQLDLTINNKIALFGIQRNLGQTLFNPPNVAGWAGGKSWIDNATLMLRLNLPQVIFTAANLNTKAKDDLEGKGGQKFLKRLEVATNLQPFRAILTFKDKLTVMTELSDYLLAKQITEYTSDLERFTDKKSEEAFVKTLIMRLMMLPEYQLC